MALVLADRVQEYSTTTGTGTLTLSGAYAGFQTFAAGIGNGNTCYYTITSDKNQWEVGIGTVGVGTLARTTLISSSTGSTIDFKGTLTVFVTLPAEEAVYGDGTTLVAPSGALLPITSGGTGASTAGAARTALGLGTIATQAANSVAITGGSINGTTVGSTTAAAGSFTTLTTSGQVNFNSTSLAGPSIVFATNSTQTSGYMEYAVTDGSRFAEIGLVKTFSSSYGLANEAFVRASGSTTGLSISSASINPIRFSVGTSGSSAEQFRISNTASAVNYAQVTGAATGAAPALSAQGSDATVGLNITSKSFGAVNINTGTGTVAKFIDRGVTTIDSPFIFRAGALGVQQGALTLPVSTTIQTPDNFISFRSQSGTTGAPGGQIQFFINNTSGGTSAVNYLQVAGAVTTGAPEISAQGSDANINLKLTTKGTGVLQFGTYTAGVLTPTGYITITDAGGTSRRLLVG